MRIRPMLRTDIAAGMGLVEEAKWNQTEADWGRFLDSNGCFVAEVDGQVRGTVASIVYEDSLAWIGMMLVASACRGRGIGRQLLETALASFESMSVAAVKLDATPQGQPLYAKLGFIPEYEIERWILDVAKGNRLGRSDQHGEEHADASLDEIIEADRDVFGIGRGSLLRGLHRDAPGFTVVVRSEGQMTGCTLGRRGLRADHLGPWLARDEKTAGQLLNRFLVRSERDKIIVDVPKSNPYAGALLTASGFRVSRPFTRMVRGAGWPTRASRRLWAILGPEFG